MTAPFLLDSAEALAHAVACVVERDPVLARLVAGGAHPPLRNRDAGLPGLAAIVVGQQVSTASAAAILKRLLAAFDPLSAERLANAGDADLMAVGLSRPKIRTLRAIAGAITAGALPLADLHLHEPDGARTHLTAVSGIGPWTAEIYLLFCLGHPDAFPAGDLAIQEAARVAYGLPSRPDARTLTQLAERWRPWRGAAAGVLWAYYRQIKARDGVLPAG